MSTNYFTQEVAQNNAAVFTNATPNDVLFYSQSNANIFLGSSNSPTSYVQISAKGAVTASNYSIPTKGTIIDSQGNLSNVTTASIANIVNCSNVTASNITASNTTTSNIGVGCTPQYPLDVVGNINCTGNISAGNLGMFRNRIINGDMRIDQRGLGAYQLVPYTFNCTCDRWVSYPGTSNISMQTASLTSADTPYNYGLSKCILLTATTSVPNGLTYSISQNVESILMNDFLWDTGKGYYATLSFWFNASKSGNYNFCIQTSGGNSSYNGIFVYTTGQWQWITCTIPPPPSGYTQYGNTTPGNNAFALNIGYWVTTTGSTGWISSGITNNSASFNWAATVNAYIKITGVQFEKGTIATPFEYRPYPIELQLCQRYLMTYGYPMESGLVVNVGLGYAQSATLGNFPVRLPVSMCSVPTMTSTTNGWASGIGAVTLALNAQGCSQNVVQIQATGTFTTGQGLLLNRNNNSTAYIRLTAEPA